MDLYTIEFAVDIVVYFMFLTGLCMLMSGHIYLISQQFSLRHRLKAVRKQASQIHPVFRSIRNMLFILFKNPPGEKSFCACIAAIFLLFLVVSLRYFSPVSSLAIALMSASMPILFMIVKVEATRKKGSKEGISVISELYRQYWMHNKNIFSAVEQTVKGNAQCPICKNLLYKLLLRLRNTGNPLEIRECIDQFAFSLGTVWGKMLGVCIRLSAEKGIDVSEGIADILDQLKTANNRAEERRRINSESARMTLFLIPVLYFGTLFVSLYYLDISFLQLVKNQFGTPEGFLFFLMISFLFLMNFSIIELVQNQKIDY